MSDKEKSTLSQRDLNHQRMCKVKDFRYTDKPHPCVELTVAGLNSASFDRECNPRTPGIMWIDMIRRYYALSMPIPGRDDLYVFLDWPRISNELYAFGKWAEMTMTRALYDLDIPKWELDYKFSLGHVGNSAVTKYAESYARDADGKKILVWKICYQQVMVDKRSRTPTRVPAWFKDKYEGTGCVDLPAAIRPFRKPDLTFAHPIMVRWSETDDYGHANWSSYMGWVTDAIHAALQPKNRGAGGAGLGALLTISQDTISRGLAKFQVCYYRECLEGDHVDIHIWQDQTGKEKCDELVWCLALKDGEDIFQGKLWYFAKEA